jgi:hypothetical protein
MYWIYDLMLYFLTIQQYELFDVIITLFVFVEK